MAALRGMKRRRRADADTEERQGCHLAPKSVAEKFLFVSCAEVKEESEEAVDKQVGTLKEHPVTECEMCIKEKTGKVGTLAQPSVPECEVCIKEETGKVGTFEEVSVPERDACVKEEMEETNTFAATSVLEQDPLQIEEEEEVNGTTRNAPDSERLTQNSNSGRSTPPAAAVQRTAAHGQLGTNSAMSRGSASRGHRLKRRCQKAAVGTRDSRSGGCALDDFTCNSCQQTFPSKYALLTHVFVHIDAVGPPLHICRLCGDVFPTQRCLQMHCLHIHLKNLCIVAKNDHKLLDTNKKRGNYHKQKSIQSGRDTAERRKGNVSPRTDGASFHQEENDMPQPESRVNDSWQKSSSKDAILPKRKHSRTGEGPDVCHSSSTSLASPAHLKQLALDNSVDLPYNCSDCGRYFKHKVHLQQHAASHRKKLIVCDDCGRTFKRPVDLRQHTLSHTGEKPHVCKCGKSFAKSGSLKRHEMLHRGERPFRCDVCFKTFTDAGVLKKHAVVHTGERAYVCGECGKAFKEAGHLRRHKLLHTGEKPYVCRVCGMSFTQSASIKRHTRVHTGEKPYTCPVCSKSFADRSNWRVHTVSHHGGKIHKCDICEKRFRKHTDLLKHVKVHIL